MSEGEPKSWGDSIRAYETSKKTLPWQPREVQSIVKLDAFERRTLERQVNPVLMQYRDPVQELDFTQTLQARTEAKRTKGQAGQPFNIVNHEGPPRKNPAALVEHRGKREWNLLSHMPDKLHTKAPTEFNQEFQIECTKRKSVLDGLNLARGRDYSILSNKFNKNDSARRLEEHLDIQDHIRKEYTRTRVYDPIKAQDYDEEREQQWRVQHQKDKQRQRERQEASIPKSVKYAEGSTYNILTTEVTNADRLMQMPDRALHRYQGRATKIAAAKVEGDQRATLQEERRMNRISYDRWEKTIDRGFDFVFGGPVALQPVPKPRPSIWTRLHTDAPVVSTSAAVASSSSSSGGPRGQSFRTKDLSNMHSAGQHQHEEQEQQGYEQARRRGMGAHGGLAVSTSHGDSFRSATASARSADGGGNYSNGNNNLHGSSSNNDFTRSLAQSNSARMSRESRVPALNLGVCPSSPVTYKVPSNSLPGEPIAMVRTGGGLSSY